jgi:hypothetical protein
MSKSRPLGIRITCQQTLQSRAVHDDILMYCIYVGLSLGH